MLTPPEVTHYWNYAELINEELGKTAQYVEPDKENYNTYSLAYAKIILSACSEIEVVCKLLCQQIDPQKDYVSSEILNKSGSKLVKNMVNMEELSTVLLQRFPHIYQAKSEVRQKQDMIYPFKYWQSGPDKLPWWEEHNLIKHYRHSHFTQDSLERDVLRLENELTTVLKQGVFLFDFDEVKQVNPLISSLISLLTIREDHSRFWECYSNYMKAVKDAQEILLPKVEHSISIGK